MVYTIVYIHQVNFGSLEFLQYHNTKMLIMNKTKHHILSLLII